MFQKPWKTHMYWLYIYKSAQSIPIQNWFWNRPLRLPSFDSNWIQNGISELKPNIIVYRDYKNFDNAKFRYDIVTATSNVCSFGMYKNIIFSVFNRHIPIKKKYIRANGAPFMSKELH